MKLTQERLKELLDYDPETGIFTRLKAVSGTKKGDIAGCIDSGVKSGYRKIMIDYKRYLASRLAFLYMEGYLPEHEVDHRNRIKHDDRWENLRHASHLCNMQNKSKYNNNKSGITGIHWYKKTQKWKAGITISGKIIHLGYFTNKIDATRARWQAEVKYNFPDCNTISGAYLYLQRYDICGVANAF